jgi:uncharacterized protein
VAQFGRGAIERISQRMFSEFARNIEQQLAAGGDTATAARDDDSPAEHDGGRAERDHEARTQHDPAPRAAEHDDSLDALGLVTGPVVKKTGPLLLAAVIGFGYGYLLGRLRGLTR